MAPPLSGAGGDVARCPHVVRRGDILSSLLHQRGVTARGRYRLYGPQGWVSLTEKANPAVGNWRDLAVGDEITLVLPPELAQGCTGVVPAPAPVHRQNPEGPEAATMPQAQADAMPAREQSSAPPPLPPSKPPTATTPQTPLEKPARKNQGRQRGEKLRKWMKASIDMRYGKSLEPAGETLLLPKLAQFSLVLETRAAELQKLRMYLEYTPAVRDRFMDQTFSMEGMRLFLGRALYWDLASLATFELTPKIGYWRYHAVMPLVMDGELRSVRLGFSRQPSLGGDIAVLHRFGAFTPRLWHGRDFTASLLRGDSAGGLTYRTGLECRLDGPSRVVFGERASVYALVYVMNESTRITDGQIAIGSGLKDSLGNGESVTDNGSSKEMLYGVNYAGLGLGLSW
jgi:hypothetical protein